MPNTSDSYEILYMICVQVQYSNQFNFTKQKKYYINTVKIMFQYLYLVLVPPVTDSIAWKESDKSN